MPKTKLAEAVAPKAPPIDWLWAAVLERKSVLGYDLKRMSEVVGCHYDTMRKYIRQSPTTWPEDVRAKILKEFGIKAKVTIMQMPQQGQPDDNEVGI